MLHHALTRRGLLVGALSLALTFSTAPVLAESTAPVEGVDYTLVDPPVAPRSGDKIEVIEVFSYACSHCATLQPMLATWKKNLPDDVQFEYIPTPFGNINEAYARAYHTAVTMGVIDLTHDALFTALHTEQRPIGKLEDLADFYAEHGVDKEQFMSTLESFPVDAKIVESRTRVVGLGAEGTPALFVDGKYRLMATREKGFEGMLKTADALIEKARAERAAAK